MLSFYFAVFKNLQNFTQLLRLLWNILLSLSNPKISCITFGDRVGWTHRNLLKASLVNSKRWGEKCMMHTDKNKGRIYVLMEKCTNFSIKAEKKVSWSTAHALTIVHVHPWTCIFFLSEINILVLFLQMRTPDCRIPSKFQNNHRNSHGGCLEQRSDSYSIID